MFVVVVGNLSVVKAGKRYRSKTIEDIMLDEERFLLFNSRQLTGECGKYRVAFDSLSFDPWPFNSC